MNELFFWNAAKIERVIAALKADKEPETYVSPQVLVLKCFELTLKGKVTLSAFPEEAIAFASSEHKDISGSENSFYEFKRLAESWCETRAVKPRWSLMFNLLEALHLPKQGKNVMNPVARSLNGALNNFIATHTDETKPNFGGVKFSKAGNNPRAVYIAPNATFESPDYQISKMLSHWVCLDKLGNSPETAPKLRHIRSLGLVRPPLSQETLSLIKSDPRYVAVDKTSEHEKLLGYSYQLVDSGIIKCTYHRCLDGTFGDR